MHYYKFNIKDWSRDTAHLSVEEEGVYRRLLDHYYESESPIPLETKSVIRRLRLAGHEEATSIILGEFFSLEEDGYHHKRCDDEIEKYHSKAVANRENGKRGGRPVKPKENPDGSQQEPKENLNHKPLTTNQEPEDKSSCNQAAPDNAKAPAVPFQKIMDAYCQALPNLPQPQAMTEKRKTALRGIWREFEKCHADDFWQRYFAYVGKSDFLVGMRGIGIDWLINKSNFYKVIEGNYHA